MKNEREVEVLRLDNEKICSLMEAAFAQSGCFTFRPTGKSMLPMLREHKDAVTLCSPEKRPPRILDVILYRRADGQLVLHRIIGRKNGCFRLCGDRQTVPEDGVCPDSVIGVLTGFYRGEKHVSADSLPYRIYAAARVLLRPVRRVFAAVFRRLPRFTKNG